MRIVKLTPPETDVSKYIGYNVGIRPARKNGPRIERENFGEKTIYHNYGHAGYGVTMSYGSAKYIVNKFVVEDGRNMNGVAVIGCGYMGLHSAILLRKYGFEVTIFAENFPAKFGVFNESKDKLTSQIAAGLILPSHFDYSPNKNLNILLCKETYEYLEQMWALKKYKGILKRDIYFIQAPAKSLDELIRDTMTPPEEVRIDFGKGNLVPAIRFGTFQCDGDIFLNELLEEAKLAGVKIVKRKFEKTEEIFSLKEKVVFNCSGMSSRYLFNDPNMVPLKGVMLSLKKPEGYDYFIECYMNDKSYAFTTYPMNDRISYGLIKIEEEELGFEKEQKYLKILYENIKEFKEKFIEPKPKL